MFKAKSFQQIFRRFKHKDTHWSVVGKKTTPKDRALKTFDDFYGSVFGGRWKSIRLALLCQHKYIAMVNNFGDSTATIQNLEGLGAIDIRKIFEVSKAKLKPESKEVSADQQNVYKLESRIGSIMERQKTQELSNIFPENASQRDGLQNEFENDEKFESERVIDSAYGTAGLYEYIPATTLKGMEDWVFESDHYKYYKANDSDFPIDVRLEPELDRVPEHLNLFTYEMGNINTFPNSKKCLTGAYSHYMMDGASILPVIFLGIDPGDRVLDACAGPGGKSLLMLQTLNPNILVCNDIYQSRTNRIKNVMRDFVFDFDSKWLNKRVFITEQDARAIEEYGQYDKILVDVPCTTDRHSLLENDNNIFRPNRIKERLKIPELQAGILSNCLRLLKPGGTLVYSTCSLSPIQNDGVVHMALSKAFTENGVTASVHDLSIAIQPFAEIFKFQNPKSIKYGQLVLPFLPANFGPMYFSKITRVT